MSEISYSMNLIACTSSLLHDCSSFVLALMKVLVFDSTVRSIGFILMTRLFEYNYDLLSCGCF